MRERINLQSQITIVREFPFINEKTANVMYLLDTIKNVKMIFSILIIYLNKIIALF